MSGEQKRRGLGRGLSSLLGDVAAAVDDSLDAAGPTSTVRHIPIGSLVPGKFQPRQVFDEEALEALADSIREKGVLQPLLVRPHPENSGTYEIIAGERRWRAAQQAQVHQVPVLVRELNDQQAAEVALIENLQRQDLSPLEEAEGYRRLQEEFSHTQEELSRAIGKSRSHIANTMRLLNLPDPVKDMVSTGTLSAGHARALLTVDDPVGLARKVAERGLNVRQTEALVQQTLKRNTDSSARPSAHARKDIAKDADTLSLEREMSALLGLAVTIDHKGEKGGTISLQYASLEQLDDLLARLRHGRDGEKVLD